MIIDMIASTFIPLGRSQNIRKQIVAPIKPRRQVRWARLLKNLSVAHPARRVPMIPPTISDEATTVEATWMLSPLSWVRKVAPQSRMVNLMTYTQKFATARIQMTGFLNTIFFTSF